MSARRGVFALALTAIAIVGALMAGSRGSSAIGLQATWTLTGRADATSFRPGPELPSAGQGFEVISFAAAGPSGAIDSYVYAGADAATGSGAPTRPFVSCNATASAGVLTLSVGNAFPYAGCVYFPTATNTGDRPIEVDLGSLAHPAGVFCGLATCRVDIVAGGVDETGIARRCTSEGATARSATSALTYRLQPGAAISCPVFVVLLQPAAEATTYSVAIEAPRPRGPGPTGYVDIGPLPPRPPVAAATPRPPRTGFGLVVESDETQPGDGTAVFALVSAGGLLGALLIATPRRRRRSSDEQATDN